MTGIKKYLTSLLLLGLFATGNAVALTSQTITVTTAAPASAAYGSHFLVFATASSGLYVSIAGSGGCSGAGVGGANIAMTSSTTNCVVTYNQAGDATYAAATQISSSTTATKAAQTITVTTPAPSNATINSSFTVYASASSGLYVSVSTTGGCSGAGAGGAGITMGSTLTNCTVTYDQSGDTNYNAATQVSSTTVAQKVSQTISFSQPANVMLGVSPFALTATASSALSVTFSSSTTSICTVTSGGAVTAVASGECIINANQAGDSTYQAAPQVSRTIFVNKTISSAQVKYLWIDGGTGKFRFSTVSAPSSTDACLSNYGYFISSSADILALLVDAKINGNYIDITYAARPSTRACNVAPSNTDDLLAVVSTVSITSATPSPVSPAPITGASGPPFTLLTGVELNWFWVDGNDGYVRTYPSTTLPADACNGFKFNGQTDVGRKMFSLMAAAKMKNEAGSAVPLTVWYPSNVGSCGSGDAALMNVTHVGLMY